MRDIDSTRVWQVTTWCWRWIVIHARARGRVTALVCVGLLAGCGRASEKMDIEVVVDGDRVTIDWDDRPVHAVEVLHPTDGPSQFVGWRVAVSAELPMPETEALIVPPIHYGEPVDNNAVSRDAEPLVRGTTYVVGVSVHGWGQTCEDHGISDFEEEPATAVGPDCDIAFGRKLFTY